MSDNINQTNKEPRTGGDILRVIRTVLRTVGSSIATFLMVAIITGCIVASVLTVYILQSIGSEAPVTLDAMEMGYTTIMYAYDKDGREVEVKRLYDTNNNRIPIDYVDINQFTKDAMVAIEDKRFFEHEGVDWIRTTGAFVNYVVPIWPGTQGGSTIHQQLIKNITGDDDYRIDRKVREIFRALNLAQNYTHEQVLEAYLNVVPFGGGSNGIQAAANVYFGKDAKDLTLAEVACIVGITQKPTAYNPLLYPDDNKNRQKQVLNEMLDQKMIDKAQYEAALVEPLLFEKRETAEVKIEPSSWFEDHAIETVIRDLMKLKDITYTEASRDLFVSGYRIYLTVDLERQKLLEDFYLDEANFPPINKGPNDEYPQSDSVIMEPNGKVIALVGGRGTKTASRGFNRATMGKRQPGSTLKPIGPYALAFEYNLLTPSSIIEDSPINPEAPNPADYYPRNYYGGYLGPVTVERAITNSINTVAVKTTQMVTPASLFDFYYYDLGMTSLVYPTDIDIAPMALGGLTEGVTMLELVGAYQMIVNGGYFTPPYVYTKVTDSEGKIVLKPDTIPRQVIEEDTSILLNKMTQGVISDGTGYYARIEGFPTGGKTGTSNDDIDQWFIGFTPYYIGGVWLGYDKPIKTDKYGNEVKNSVFYLPHPYPTPYLFHDVMAPLHEGLLAEGETSKEFITSPQVTQHAYCGITGKLMGPNCVSGGTTWYKESNLPAVCNGIHGVPKTKTEDDPEGDSASATDTSSTVERPFNGGETIDGNPN